VIELEQKTTNPDSSLAEELFQLHKEFAAFNDFYACFCDALAEVVEEDKTLDAGSVEGVCRCAHWMKHRMEGFSARLKAIQQKSCSLEEGS